MPWAARMTLFFSLIAAPFYFYVGFRLTSAISSISSIKKKKAKKFVFLFITWFYLLPINYFLYDITGNMDNLFLYQSFPTWQDYVFLFPFWWSLVLVLEAVPFFIILDFSILFRKIKRFLIFKNWTRWQAFIKIGLIIASGIYTGHRIYFDTTHIRKNIVQIPVQNLPVEFKDLTLCFMGDLHIDRYFQGKRLNKLKNILQSTKSDLVFFSGDLITQGDEYISAASELLKNPKAKIGSFACMGDHDYWTAPEIISNKLSQNGWTFLENQHYVSNYKGKSILVTGITHIYGLRMSEFELNKILNDAPYGDLKILIVHQPSEFIIKAAEKYGYHIILGGHTHGGQIVTHIFGFPIAAIQEETPFYSGLYTLNNLHIYITNGVGLELAPIRYHAPSEISHIILASGNKD